MDNEEITDGGAPKEPGSQPQSEEEAQKEYERGAAVAQELMGKRRSNRMYANSPRPARPEAPAAKPAEETKPEGEDKPKEGRAARRRQV